MRIIIVFGQALPLASHFITAPSLFLLTHLHVLGLEVIRDHADNTLVILLRHPQTAVIQLSKILFVRQLMT